MRNKHKKPVYLKIKPYYLVRIPWGVTTGSPQCPSEYYNSLQAAVHSLLSAMQMDSIDHAISWMTTARRQINGALREAKKPGATVPVEDQEYSQR